MDELEQLKRDNEVLYRDNVALSETADRMREALEELIEVSDLRGDIDEIPHPCDDPKLWTARLIQAWDDARQALRGEGAG